MKYFGKHICISGSNDAGSLNTLYNFMQKNKITCGQIFLRNPQSLSLNNTQEKRVKELSFLKNNNPLNFKIVVHSPYVLNFCHPINSDLYNKSINILIADLNDAYNSGCIGCVIHMGKNIDSLNQSFGQALNNYVEGIVECIHKTKNINTKIILETASGQGSECGLKLKNLGKIKNKIFEKLPLNLHNRLGFCIDTCHIFSAGYDLNNDCDRIIYLIEKYINWKLIDVIHVNNSKTECCSYIDRHENIEDGYIKKDKLEYFIKKALSYNENILCVLETPNEKHSEEIEWLKNIL